MYFQKYENSVSYFSYWLIHFKWRCISAIVSQLFVNTLYSMSSVWKSLCSLIFIIYRELQKSRFWAQFGEENWCFRIVQQ